MKIDINIENTKELDLYDILNTFQNSATTHGTKLGVGHECMLSKDLFWVLLRTKFIIDDNTNNDFVITTYPKVPGRLDYDREYFINSNGNTIIKGISKWLIASVSTRKIVRNSGVSFPNECVSDSIFDSVDKINIDIDKFKLVDTYKVSNSDLDLNNHVNNASYAHMIKKVYNTSLIKEFQIDYINEVLNNELVELLMYKDNDNTYILGLVEDKKCFVAQIKEK